MTMVLGNNKFVLSIKFYKIYAINLDILEDYCNYRRFSYCRIDGNTDMNDRDS